jgi:hypothetical protein
VAGGGAGVAPGIRPFVRENFIRQACFGVGAAEFRPNWAMVPFLSLVRRLGSRFGERPVLSGAACLRNLESIYGQRLKSASQAKTCAETALVKSNPDARPKIPSFNPSLPRFDDIMGSQELSFRAPTPFAGNASSAFPTVAPGKRWTKNGFLGDFRFGLDDSGCATFQLRDVRRIFRRAISIFFTLLLQVRIGAEILQNSFQKAVRPGVGRALH